MKTHIQLAASLLAATGLLFGAASHATNLAELPLKPSVLAKPNVIFGMDDSGSMDSELMLYNNDGAFWWNFDDRTGWGIDAAHPNPSLRTITSTWFNSGGDSGSTWRKMVYLFPNGTGTGNRVYNDAANDHFAIMPTRQFAFLRWSGIYKDTTTNTYKSAPTNPADSPMHNPIYYNPLVTYQPWAPAQLSGGAVTPARATTTAARSHPIYPATGAFTFNLTADVGLVTDSDKVFTALPGMRVPNGAKKNVCSSSNGSCPGWVNVTADEDAANSKVTRVAMSYYPATYWVREACTPENSSVANDTCTYVPGSNTVTLKRYEIKAGNTFPSGRSYTDEIQNFANWFQYYRKRKLMLAAAMGDTMEYLTGMRLGVVPFNANAAVTMYDADSTDATKNRLRVAGIFYETDRSGGTPTRETLKYIGDQYKRTDTSDGQPKSATNTYKVVQYACQRNNAFIVTDGFANNSAVTPPAYDNNKSYNTWTNTGAAPYGWTFNHDGVLADLALRYYTNNPRSDLAAGKLQATPSDANTDLHMNTYGLSLGARGTLWLSESTAAPTNTASWPDPNTPRSPTSVDDLWHATVTGRGKMYLATTPEETALRIQSGLNDMQSLEGAQSGVAVSAVNLDRGDGRAYLGYYNQRGWTGDIEARGISAANAQISNTVTWSAAARLAAATWSDRKIFTFNSSGTGVTFTSANIGNTVNPDSASYTNDQIVNYLRGERSNEGELLRTRLSLMGPVVNAEPVLGRDENVVYVASGEGMLHALDSATGNELWAFAPRDTLAAMGRSAVRGWVYNTLLDATPTYGKLSTGTKLLVGGLGAAGRSYYALNVSAPRDLTAAQAAAQFSWSFPTSGDTANQANMGYTVGKPQFARVKVSGTLTDVVLVTSGYDNATTIGDGRGRLWMLRASDGAVLKSFKTGYGTAGTGEAGLAHVSAFREPDGSVRYAYGGDLLGYVWRFDLEASGSTDIDATLLATLKDSGNKAQPVTSMPELALINGKRVVLVATGRLLDLTDLDASSTNSVYVIVDGAALTNARSSLTARTYTRGSTPELSGSAINWGTGRGWYFDLPADEHVNTDVSIAYGTLVFVTNKNSMANCAQASWMYYVDVESGLAIANHTEVSAQLWSTYDSSRPVPVRAKDGVHVLVQSSGHGTGSPSLDIGRAPLPGKNAWREIRR